MLYEKQKKKKGGGKMSIEIIIEKDFLPLHTFDCGQCFRWNENADGSFTGVAGKCAVKLSYDGKTIKIDGAEKKDEAFFREYLDIDRDYSLIKERLSKNPVMKEAVNFGSGIRILKQEFLRQLFRLG